MISLAVALESGGALANAPQASSRQAVHRAPSETLHAVRLRGGFDQPPPAPGDAAPEAKHRVLHDTSDVIHAPFYNREWALAWNNLDEPWPKDRPPVWPLPAVVNVTDIKPRKERYPKDTVARIKAADAAAKKAKLG